MHTAKQVDGRNSRFQKTDMIAARYGLGRKLRRHTNGKTDPLSHERPFVGTVRGEHLQRSTFQTTNAVEVDHGEYIFRPDSGRRTLDKTTRSQQAGFLCTKGDKQDRSLRHKGFLQLARDFYQNADPGGIVVSAWIYLRSIAIPHHPQMIIVGAQYDRLLAETGIGARQNANDIGKIDLAPI